MSQNRPPSMSLKFQRYSLRGTTNGTSREPTLVATSNPPIFFVMSYDFL